MKASLHDDVITASLNTRMVAYLLEVGVFRGSFKRSILILYMVSCFFNCSVCEELNIPYLKSTLKMSAVAISEFGPGMYNWVRCVVSIGL